MVASALTRIKNNQITDSTIWANAKIVPGSIVGSLFNTNLTMTSDVTITGNLTVQGASTYLTVASTNTYVNDPLIVLNNAFSGTNTYDLGFVFNRGSLQNTALIWNEFNKEFRLVGTTETGTTYGNINQSNFANLRVGNLNVQYALTISSLAASSLNVTGNVLTGLLQAAAINSTPIGNATPSTATFTYVTTGNVLSGFVGNTGTQFTGASLNVSGNVDAATVLAQLVTSDDATFGNVAAGFIGNTSTVFTGGSINLSGNVLGGLAQFAAINSTPVGNSSASTGAFTTLSAANNLWANASISTTAQGIGAIVVPNGGISVAGAANIGGTLTAGGATQLNSTLGVGGITTFTNPTNSTSASDGAVIIQGGASITKDLWVGGNLYAANIIGVSANVITVQDPLLYLRPQSVFPYNYDIGIYSAFTGTGLTTAGNVYQHTGVFRDPTTNTWTFASNLAEPSASYITVDGSTVYDPIKAGNLNLVTNIPSTTSGTGALIVAGGAGIGGNIFQGGAYHDTSSSNFIFATTPTTVDAFKAATTLNVGANSGTLTIGNPTVVGTQTTQNLYNTTATTVNAFGAATALTVGAATGYTAVQNANLWLPNATSIDGAQATVSLLNTNATSVNAFGAATNLVLGATSGVSYLRSANITLPNASTISVGQSSFNLANSAATSVNAFGAATTLNFGSGTGITTVRNRFHVDRADGNGNSLEGSFRVVGTAAFGSNIFVGNGAVFNDLQTSENFTIKTTSSTAGLIYSTSQQQLIINAGAYASNTTPIPGATLAVRAKDSILIPVGTTADRPSNTGNVDIQGMLRYNTSAGNMEWFNGTSWQTPGASTTIIQDYQINGDGSTTTFAVNNATTTNATIVSVNGVLQLPTISYAMVGGNIVFTEAPATGDVIDVRSLTTTTTITSLSSSNGFMVFDVSSPGSDYANITAGTASATVRVSLYTDGTLSYVNDTKVAVNGTAYNIAANNTPYTLDTFVQSRYSTAEYKVTAKRGTGATANIESYSATVITDGSGTAYITTYGIINNGYAMGVLSANVLAGNVQLYYTGTNAATAVQANVKIYATYIV
jgi:hypothetical protein